jgi:muramoyltetrapeptide carboxypeptidase
MLPKRLQPGDTIGIVSPSKNIDAARKAKLQNAIAVLERDFDLRVKLGKHVYAVDKYGCSAGSPEQKAEDINASFADKSVKAIWCSLGGNTANDVLDLLDYDLIKDNPKIFMGLSDITVLLNAIHHKTELVTFHNGDPRATPEHETFADNYSQQQFKKRLMGGEVGELDKISEWKCVRPGTAKGKLLGGNLSCLLKLAGTPYMPDFDNAILLLEGYTLEIDDAQCKLNQLKQMGIFDKIAGVVVGFMYSFQREPGYQTQFEDILLDVSRGYDFPILKINEFGHKCPNTPLPIGGAVEMDAEKLAFKILEACVE